MTTVDTFFGTIYVGTRVQYTPETVPLEVGERIVQEFVDSIGQCFSVMRTKFIYKKGSEDGLVVGAINYPRFPKEASVLKSEVLTLAQLLKDAMKQMRVTVVFLDETVMLGD